MSGQFSFAGPFSTMIEENQGQSSLKYLSLAVVEEEAEEERMLSSGSLGNAARDAARLNEPCVPAPLSDLKLLRPQRGQLGVCS